MAASRTAELSGTANQNRAPTIELATSAPTRPAQVLLGETRGHSFGPAHQPAGEEARGIGGDDDDNDEDDGQQPERGSERSQIRATAGRPA